MSSGLDVAHTTLKQESKQIFINKCLTVLFSRLSLLKLEMCLRLIHDHLQ